jgi:tellurium resistance protein TerD
VAINLEKGGTLNLSKSAKSLSKVLVGLGWEPAETGHDFDLDASALLLKADGKVPSDGYLVFYNQPESACGSVHHSGDDRTGGNSDGDDEVIEVNLDEVPKQIERVLFVVSIDAAKARGQNFGQVSNAYIRIVDASSDEEIVRYDLGEDFSSEIGLHFGELYRDGSAWQFKAIGKGFQDDLGGLIRPFGVNA